MALDYSNVSATKLNLNKSFSGRIGDVQTPLRLIRALCDDAAHHVGADPRRFLPGSLLVRKLQAFGIVGEWPSCWM